MMQLILTYCCSPRGERLDVKKSGYKKMSAFVKAMQEQGVVTVKQLTKGVDSIVDIHRDCDMYVSPSAVLLSFCVFK